MNELGLTRESIRAMVEEIVIDTVTRHMSAIEDGGRLQTIITDVFEKNYNTPKNRYERFRDLVSAAAKEAAAKFVAEKLAFAGK